MFGGMHELSIDSKGRLAIPAKFRELLSRRYSPALVVTLDSRSHFLLYPEEEWQKTAAAVMAMDVNGKPHAKRYQSMVLHNAETLELDSAGRILLPAHLRRRVDFDKEVTLVGRVDRLELWGRERWEADMNALLDMDTDELDAELAEAGFRL
ncbi:MAG: division/cell wall cluster transcriptional repressor MraZ [Eikenella sp.]|nr:division/cell wall cluster transcriptional repressor MraZ [Eikenella sp.]